MASASTLPAWPASGPVAAVHRLHLPDSVWRAPLVPVALALTAGILLDRYGGVPLSVSLIAALVFLAASVASLLGRPSALPLVYLAGTVGSLGAAYHHGYCKVYSADDIGAFASAEPRPVKLRGVLVEEPAILARPKEDPLRSFERPEPTTAVLEVSRLHDRHDWVPVSGRAVLFVEGPLASVHIGDEIEVVGSLMNPQPPANAGELDSASFLRDKRIRAVVGVRKNPEAVRKRFTGSWSIGRSLMLLRGWGRRTLETHLPLKYQGLAVALILGEDAALPSAGWEKYKLTGVIHVLVISGQHLVILAGFLWIVLKGLGIPRRRGAWFTALFLVGYAVLTGARPPAVRCAVTMCVLCLGLILRRPILPTNSLALAWLVVILLNPTDIFTAGCQLSFLSVAILYWGFPRWVQFRADPLDPLLDAYRPAWLRSLRGFGRLVAGNYLMTLMIWLALAPLVAARYHTVPYAALVIGPIVMVIAAVVLLAGFLMLLAAFVLPLASLFALVTGGSLAACEGLVDVSWEGVRAYCFVGDIPAWWPWIFYLGFLAVLMLETVRRHWRWVALAGLGWLCVGLVSGWTYPTSSELRCTFLSVGHGGCAVLETPDGRTLLYDAGAMNGPDVARKQIAPFLWSRGIRRIDEVFLSHADLDHFNGLPPLLDRFAVGRVTCTPSFEKKSTRAVEITLETLKRRGIAVRKVWAGDILSAGDVSIEVLHPPAIGPDGNENARSLVLLVRHAGHAILLTGDLEGTGMQRVLGLPPPRVDVLMAPHHGSRRTDTPGLVRKTRPKLVVACLGPPRGATRPPDPEMAQGVPFWGTWPHGAITIRSRQGSLVVETFRTDQRLLLRER